MWTLLRAECYQLLRRRAFWGLCVGCVALASVLLLDSRRETAMLFLASLYNTPVLFFLVILFAALFVGAPLEERCLAWPLLAGYGRTQVLAAKGIAYVLGVLLLSGTPLLLHGALGVIDGERAPSLAVCALTLLALVAMGLLPFVAALALGDVGRTVAVMGLGYFVMIFWLNGIFSGARAAWLPMGQWRLLALGHTDSLGRWALVDGSWLVVLSVFAWWLFRHKELR